MNRPLDLVRSLARGDAPTQDLQEFLTRHGCHYWLKTHYGGMLSAESVLNRMCVQARFQTCAAVFRTLEEQNIPYAVIKGAVLSKAAYDDPFCRRSGDIDVLIDRRHIDRLKPILRENGFQQGRVTANGIVPFSRRQLLFQSAMSHQIAPFIAKTDNPLCPYVNMDINFDVLWGESTQRGDMAAVLAHTARTSICDVAFSKLTPAMEFVALCLHHYKDMNSPYLLYEGGLRVGHFCDLYYYLKNAAPSIDAVKTIGDTLGVTAYIYYCVYYTNTVFGTELTAQWCRAFRTAQGEALLPCFGLKETARHRWDIDFEARLFHSDLRSHLQTILSETELASIEFNRENM